MITKLSETILAGSVILGVMAEVQRRLALRVRKSTTEIPDLHKQTKKLNGEIARLVEAISTTAAALPPLVEALSSKQKLLGDLGVRMKTLGTAPSVLDLEVRRVEREAKKRLGDLRGALRRNPEEAKKSLEAILEGPLVFTPVATAVGPRYRIEGQANVGTIGGVPSGIRT